MLGSELLSTLSLKKHEAHSIPKRGVRGARITDARRISIKKFLKAFHISQSIFNRVKVENFRALAISPPPLSFSCAGAGRQVRPDIGGQPGSCWFPGLREPSATPFRLSFLSPRFSLQVFVFCGWPSRGWSSSVVVGLVSLAGFFFRRQVRFRRREVLAGFRPVFLCFSDPVLCSLPGCEAVRLSGLAGLFCFCRHSSRRIPVVGDFSGHRNLAGACFVCFFFLFPGFSSWVLWLWF